MTKFITRLIVLLAITVVNINNSFAQLGTVPTLASSNVSEASQYGVVYAIDLPTNAAYSTQSAINYAVNNSGVSGINFKRVAYFMQLDSKWVWASMDKFNANVSLTDLGIPASNSSVGFQQVVTNLHVYGSAGSNVTNVTTDGTNGNVEIWPQCYSQATSLSGIGGNSGTFDFNDTRSSGSGCYGSFQVHNYGASQTLFAFNNFISTGINDQGIGNNSGNANPDWTFMANANSYTTRKLYIMVDYGISSPSPATQALCINSTPTNLTVNAVAQTGTTISSYNWYSNTTNSSTGGTLIATHTSSATSDSYTPATTSTGTTYYYATMTNSAGTVVTGGTATVVVNPYPTASISGANEVCLNTTSPNITFTGAVGTAPYTFTYNINGGTNTTVTSSGNTATVAAPTSTKGIYTYNLVGVKDAAASACYQTQSGSAIITIDTLPTATISAGSATTFCPGGSVTLTSSTGVSYLWSNNATTASTSVSTSGNYTVKVTDGNGCSATSAATTVTVITLPTISPITGITAVEILAVGAGGGAGGPDGTLGAGGGAGGAVYGKYSLTSANNVYTIGVGGAGNGGIGCYSNSAGGVGGTNGGGTGGNAGTGGCSGSGGGGGGWSGLYQGSNYIVVAGGGSGGGGANEGTANDVATPGGGSQPNSANGTSMTGGNGSAFSGDGGGGGAGGGGYYGGAGQANLTGNGQASGGANYANSSNQIAYTFYTGNNGATAGAGSAGGAAVTVTNASNFGYNNTYGKGGSGVGNGNTTAQTAGTNGIVIIRYPGAPSATGGTITQSGGYTIHTFTTPGSNTFTVNPSNAVCVGSTLTLSSLTTGGVWSSSDNSIATIDATSGLVTGLKAGTVTITYSVTNSNGCVGSVTSSLTVNALPATVITAGGSTTICNGSSVTLTATAGATYLWNTGATTQSINVTTAGNYSVTVTNSSGCSASSTVTAVSVNATSTSSTNLTICASSLPYSWNGLTFNAAGTQTAHLTNSVNCDSAATLVLTVNPTNTVTLSSVASTNAQIVYLNTAIINITYTTTGATGATFSGLPTGVTGAWSANTVTISGTPTVTGVFSYTVTLTGGCGTVTATGSITVASVSITSNANANTICAGTSVTFTATPISATNPTYQWTKNGTAIAGATSSTYTTSSLANNDVIAVKMTISNATGGTTNGVVTAGLSLYLNAKNTTSYPGTGTTWYDLSGNGYNSTLSNVTYSSANNGSFSFNGSNSIVKTPSIPNTGVGGNTSVSWSAWVYPTTNSGTIMYMSSDAGGGGWNMPPLYFTNKRFIGSVYNNATISDVTDFTINTWYNVTLVYDGSARTSKLYVNGALVNSATNQNFSGPGSNAYMFLGLMNGGCCNNGNNFTGSMSSFMAYGGKALSAAEVLQNYNGGVTASLTSNPITTTVNSLPTATVTGTTAVCVNTAAPNVTFTGAAGTAPYTFTYNVNGGTNQTVTTTSGNAVTVAAPTSSTGTFIYNVVSVLDASSTTCSQTQSGTATITVNPYPTASIAGNNEVCKNAGSPNVTFTGATGTAPYTFTYNINGGSNLTVNSSGNTATVAAVTSASGIYNFNLVGVRDAATSACYQAQSGLATITIDTLPAATISAASATSFCPGGSVTLTATPGVSYLWSNNATTQSITVSAAGNYTVKVTDGKGCFATSSATAVSIYSLPVVNAITQPGQFGNGLNFDGSNDYVNLTRTIQDDFTIEFWMNTTQTGNSGGMWYQGMGLVDAEYPGVTNDFGVSLVGNKIAFGVGNPDYTLFSSSAVNTGNWVHVAATRNKSTGLMQLYINGILEASYTHSNHNSLNVPSYIYLGRDNNGNYYRGTIDEVRLWNTVRTSQDINNNMNSELTGTPSGLVNYFKFDQGVAGGNNSSVTTLTDAIGANNQSLLNFALSGSNSNWVAGAQTSNGSLGNVCVNSTLQLSNTTTGGVWTSSNTVAATVNASGLVTGVAAGTSTITYTVTNSNNCTSSVNTSITVNPLPTASISGTTTVKKGDASPNVTFTGANGTAPYTFTYTINGGSTQTVTSSGNTATVAAPTNIPGAFDYALVSVKDASGSTCSNTATGDATITVNPLQGVISGTNSVCQNATSPTITIVGSYGTAPYTFTYNINGGSTLSVTSVGNIATVTVPTTTAGTYAYNLLSVQDASALFSATSSSGTATITVKPQPTPTITGQTFACGGANGSTVSYTANGGVSYAWDNGLTPNTAINTFTTATSYTATVTATATNGCNNTASQVIPANTAPTITTIADTITLVETAVASTFTIGDAETASNLTITKSSSNTTLIPNNKIVISGTGANRTVTVTPAQDQIGTATISVTVTDCGGLSTTTSYVVTVNEPQYPSGTADFAIRYTTSKIDNCSDSVYFVNRSYNGSNATYQWYINGTLFTSPSFLSSAGGLLGYKTTLPGTYTALLVITEPGVSTYSVTKNFTLTKGIVPVPSPSFNFGYINLNGAGTASVVAYPTTPYVQGGVVNNWTVSPATNVTYESLIDAPTLTVTQQSTPQTFNVTLTVYATNGCARYSTSQQVTIPAFSRIVPNFSVIHTRSLIDGCNDSVTFINSSVGGVGGNTYTWYLGDGTTIVTTSTAPIGKVYTYPGTYTILMNAVDNTGQSVSHQFTITTTGSIPAVTAKPVVYESSDSISSSILLDGGTSTIAYGGLQYQWLLTPTVGGVASYSTASVPLSINRTNVDQTFTAQLTVTDTTVGCRTNSASQTFVVPALVPVVPTPTPITANFSINVTKSVVDHCNDSVYITNNTTGGAGSLTYTWYLGDGSIINTTSAAVIGKIYSLPGTYTVVLNVTDTAGQTVVKQLTVTTVGIIPDVVANIALYGPSNATTVSTVMLDAGNSTIANGSLSYSWTVSPTVGGAASYSSSSISLPINRNGIDQNFTAHLTVSDALTGCRSNSATQTFTVPRLAPVYVAPTAIIPAYTVHVRKSITDPCSDSVYIINTTAGGEGTLTYTWYLGDGSSITTTNNSSFGKLYSYPGNYTILLNVTDTAGQTASLQSSVTTIGTVPVVTANAIVYGPYNSDTSSTISLDGGNSTIAFGSLNYQWTVTPTVDGVASYSATNVPLTINRTNVDQVFTAQLTVKDAATGCKTNMASQTFVVPKLAASSPTYTPISAYFTVNVTKSLVDACNDSVYITNNTTGGVGTLTFNWYLGDGTSLVTTSTDVIGKIYTFPGTYTILLDVHDSLNHYVSSQKSIYTVGTIPAVNAVVMVHGPFNTDTTSSVLLNGGNSSTAYGLLTYLWTVTPDGGTATNFNTDTVSFLYNRQLADQSFTAILTVQDSLTHCRTSTTSQIYVVPMLPVSSKYATTNKILGNGNAVAVYPNPTTANINLKISLASASDGATIKIFNAIGMQVAENKINTNITKSMSSYMSLSSLPAGTYYLKVYNKTGELLSSTSVVKL